MQHSRSPGSNRHFNVLLPHQKCFNCAECPSPWVQPAGCIAGHWTRPAALRLHQHVHHQVVQNIISLEMCLFTWSYICSASATRNFVHSVSTLSEIILLALLGNDLSIITRGNGDSFPFARSARLNIRPRGSSGSWAGWVGSCPCCAPHLLHHHLLHHHQVLSEECLDTHNTAPQPTRHPGDN